MCLPNLTSVAVAIPETKTKFQDSKVGQCDLYYDSFWPTFVLLIFYSLSPSYVLNLNPIALAIREIFTGVRKFRSRSLKPGHVPFDLVFACPQNYSSYSMHTPNLKPLALAVPDIWGSIYLKNWALSAMLVLTIPQLSWNHWIPSYEIWTQSVHVRLRQRDVTVFPILALYGPQLGQRISRVGGL